MDQHLVERVLERLGLARAPTADRAGLAAVYAAWCRRVPFDNARKLIAVRTGAGTPLPGDDPDDFFEAWLRHGVGGTCWAGNGALCALLQTLGFSAQRGVATMMVAPDIPPNHGTVIVHLEEGRFIVDASILHVDPLPIIEGKESVVGNGAWGVTGHWLGDDYAIRWRSLQRPEPFDCRIDEWPVAADRFRAQHEATRDWSPFNFELTFNLVRDGGRVGVAAGQGVRIDSAGRILAAALHDRIGFLVDELGVSEELARSIPEDVPTPPPPGSRTAARG
ncbi:MAG: arylamine N-acetyltransferase [Pseudomonadales bacterium]